MGVWSGFVVGDRGVGCGAGWARGFGPELQRVRRSANDCYHLKRALVPATTTEASQKFAVSTAFDCICRDLPHILTLDRFHYQIALVPE